MRIFDAGIIHAYHYTASQPASQPAKSSQVKSKVKEDFDRERKQKIVCNFFFEKSDPPPF
jgi:hypothetical protein